jgi:hypothetical protein
VRTSRHVTTDFNHTKTVPGSPSALAYIKVTPNDCASANGL